MHDCKLERRKLFFNLIPWHAHSGLGRLGVAATLTILTSSLGILTTLSKTDGRYEFDSATVPLLSEALKWCISLSLLWQQHRVDRLGTALKVSVDWRTIRLYPIPSLIYLLHNNLQFFILKFLNPSTYQILNNLKILTTGLLFRVFLKRHLTQLQWTALLLLTIGATVSQLKTCSDSSCAASSGGTLSAPLMGYLLALLSAALSASAGVYTEYLMKQSDDSIHWQNLQLYSFGVLFNAANLTWTDIASGFRQGAWWGRLLVGYSAVTWLVVLNLSVSGLLVSWLMKYADMIVKVYATSMAMLLTMIASSYLFNIPMSLPVVLGILICCISLQLYFSSPQKFLGGRGAVDSLPRVMKPGAVVPLDQVISNPDLAGKAVDQVTVMVGGKRVGYHPDGETRRLGNS